MTGTNGFGSWTDISTVFRTLADVDRRVVLRSLAEGEGEWTDESILATALTDVRDDADHEQSLLALRHDVVPALADAGLVAVDDEDDPGSVRIASGPPPAESLYEWLADADRATSSFTSSLFEALSAPRRRLVLSELRRSFEPMEPAHLVRAVSERESRRRPSLVSRDHVDRIETSLHHVHFPHLADAGLISRQPSTDRLSASVPVGVPDAWFELGVGGRPLPSPDLEGARQVNGTLAPYR